MNIYVPPAHQVVDLAQHRQQQSRRKRRLADIPVVRQISTRAELCAAAEEAGGYDSEALRTTRSITVHEAAGLILLLRAKGILVLPSAVPPLRCLAQIDQWQMYYADLMPLADFLPYLLKGRV